MPSIQRVNSIMEEILNEKDIDSLLALSIKRLTSVLDAERVTFYFFNEDTQELWSSAVTDLEIDEVRVRLGQGIVGRSSLSRKLFNIRDAYKYRFFNKKIDKETGFLTRNVLCIPMIDRKNQLLGAIQVINKKHGHFTKSDEELFRSFANYISIAIQNIRLIQEQETLFRSTLYALAGAVDAKDPVTAGHSNRVAYFSVKIGKALALSEEQLKIIEFASYLHDVGKIAIPDAILAKKEKLTPEEYEVIKQHPLSTLQILKHGIFSKESKQIPLIASSHHEFLDGSGYPRGLKGKEINILSRIITVADIYDALSSFDRPYKKAFSVHEALRILKEEVLKHKLDKKVVNVFIKKELYKYELRKYKRLDIHTVISYRIIPQKKMIKHQLQEKVKVSPYDLDVLGYEKRESVNISEGGLLFLSKLYIPVGVYLDLIIELDTEKIKCIGKVVWTEKVIGSTNYRVGVSFINITAVAKELLAMHLRKIYLQQEKYSQNE